MASRSQQGWVGMKSHSPTPEDTDVADLGALNPKPQTPNPKP